MNKASKIYCKLPRQLNGRKVSELYEEEFANLACQTLTEFQIQVLDTLLEYLIFDDTVGHHAVGMGVDGVYYPLTVEGFSAFRDNVINHH